LIFFRAGVTPVRFGASLGVLGANFGETEKRRISVSAEIRAEKFLAAEIFFFGSNPKFGRNSASAKNIYATLT